MPLRLRTVIAVAALATVAGCTRWQPARVSSGPPSTRMHRVALHSGDTLRLQAVQAAGDSLIGFRIVAASRLERTAVARADVASVMVEDTDVAATVILATIGGAVVMATYIFLVCSVMDSPCFP